MKSVKDIGNEMKKVGFDRNNDVAESSIMRRLDEMMKSRNDSQVG